MNLYQQGLRHLGRAAQIGTCPESETWSFLLSAQVCFNGALESDPDAAIYYARAEAFEWMLLLSQDKVFISLVLQDLHQVITQERTAARPTLLLNALWFRSRLWRPFNLEGAIADLTQAIALCPTELSFYLARSECHLKRGCPDACVRDLMVALWQLIRHEHPLSSEANAQLHARLSLELALADQGQARLDRLASVYATLHEFWSNHRQYWFYLSGAMTPGGGLIEDDS